MIRGPFSRLLFDNCEIVSVAISNCEIVSVAISEFSEILGDARIVLARENRGEFHVNPQISFRFFYDPQLGGAGTGYFGVGLSQGGFTYVPQKSDVGVLSR